MKLASYLWRSRHGVFYIRIKINGSDTKRSLRTRDPKAAYRVAYQLGVLMSRNDDALKNALRNFKNGQFREYGITVSPQTGISIQTDGTPQDHQNAQEALKIILDSSLLKSEPALIHPDVTALGSTNWTLGQSIEDFWEEKSKDYRPGTVRTYQSSLRKLRNGLGEHAQLSAISNQAFVSWRITEDKRLSPETVTRDCLAYRLFFDWAIKRGRYAGNNPVEDAVLSKAIKQQRIQSHRHEHLPYTLQDLVKIFDPVAFATSKKPCSFWLPLMALYTGARLNELASLELQDFSEYFPGKFSFHIREGKTSASSRIVPIHDKLIELGLMEYIRDVKQIWSKPTLLFPYLKTAGKNGLGNLPGRDFSSYKTKLGLGETKVFHSFRKTLITCLQANGCPAEYRKIYVGHADGDNREDIHQKIYSTAKSDPNAIANLVFKHLDYEQYLGFILNIQPYKKGQFNNYLLRIQRMQQV